MAGDGGATGVPHRFADWLPLRELILFVAANLQAIGLVLLARRDTTRSACLTSGNRVLAGARGTWMVRISLRPRP
ncbi:hypothetical protein [Nonomuraea sp. 10N515B]|uniref:hypothetical protein n=1 Tax=Nonomuraea sp. 10N515B TaxID=3457422 RepID=UPI003FCCD10E